MIDYERLEKELHEFTLYLINCINRDYGYYFLEKKRSLVKKLLTSDKLVVIDNLISQNQIHINPNHKIFSVNDYDQIKMYCIDNILLNEILNMLITLHISERDFQEIDNPNYNQSCCLFLKKGLIDFISEEVSKKNRLATPKILNEQSLRFMKILKENYLGDSIRTFAFYDSYCYFCQKFFEQTGEEIIYLFSKVNVDILNDEKVVIK